jgi:hypothetical protein
MKARLAIEIDGGVHRLSEQEDALRDVAFDKLGWRVIRIPSKAAFAKGAVAKIVRTKLVELGRYKPPTGWGATPDVWKPQTPEVHPTPEAKPPTLPSRGG